MQSLVLLYSYIHENMQKEETQKVNQTLTLLESNPKSLPAWLGQ